MLLAIRNPAPISGPGDRARARPTRAPAGLPGSPELTHRGRRVSSPVAAARRVSVARPGGPHCPPRGRGNQPPGSPGGGARPSATNRCRRIGSARPNRLISGREGPWHRPRQLAPRRSALKGGRPCLFQGGGAKCLVVADSFLLPVSPWLAPRHPILAGTPPPRSLP